HLRKGHQDQRPTNERPRDQPTTPARVPWRLELHDASRDGRHPRHSRTNPAKSNVSPYSNFPSTPHSMRSPLWVSPALTLSPSAACVNTSQPTPTSRPVHRQSHHPG